MRIVFSLVGLLVVVAIVGVLAKKHLQAVQPQAAVGSAASAQPAAQAMQQRAADDVKKALEAGMQRNRDAAESGK